MSKGSLIGIVGRIQTRSYENKQGHRIYITEVVADSVTFLEKKQSESKQDSYSGTSLESVPNYGMEDLPF
jgi:single-strand DNA-binding protein